MMFVEYGDEEYRLLSPGIEVPDFSVMPHFDVLKWLCQYTYVPAVKRALWFGTGISGATHIVLGRSDKRVFYDSPPSVPRRDEVPGTSRVIGSECPAGGNHIYSGKRSKVGCVMCGAGAVVPLKKPAKETKAKAKGDASRERKLRFIAEIYVRDGRRCRYCGCELLPLEYVVTITYNPLPDNYPTLDHVKPKSKGGRWELSNLVVACPRCNNHLKKDDEEYKGASR